MVVIGRSTCTMPRLLVAGYVLAHTSPFSSFDFDDATWRRNSPGRAVISQAAIARGRGGTGDRLALATKPDRTGSMPVVNTIGMFEVRNGRHTASSGSPYMPA